MSSPLLSVSVTSDHDHSLYSFPCQRKVKERAPGKQFDEDLKAAGLVQLLSDVPELQAITLYPSQWPPQHSWALSETAVKCTVERRDGEMPLNGKQEAC